MVTALVPLIGYEAAAHIAMEALQSGRRVREIALDSGLFAEQDLDAALDPEKMTRPKAPLNQA